LSDKGLLINTIDLVEIDGNANIPTVLLYRPGAPPAFGSEALALKQNSRDINEEFKIDLGNSKSGAASARRTFPTALGTKKSAAELTADFIHEVLLRANSWMADHDLKAAPGIIVAEPLSMMTEDESSLGLAPIFETAG
jgi:hypothetical protein